MTHLLSYIAVAMASATLAVVIFAALCAGSNADDFADAMPRTLKEFDEAKAEATLYDALRKAQ